MINSRKLVLFIAIMAMFVSNIKAYDHEVWASGNTYYWKINGSEAGSSPSLSTAINSCMGRDREVHVLTSGTLNSTLTVRGANVKLYCHNNTLTCNFTGSGIMNNGNNGFQIHDLTLRNVVGGYGIRCSGASDLSFVNVRVIDIAWIGMRIDSRSSNPWNYTIYNLYMKDCRFENTGSHGLETYGIDGINLEGTMTARNNGECGVLLNQTRNGTIDVVDAYNSAWGTGYAGLRYANACQNITTDKLYADHCGRGFFLVQSGPTVNCHVNYAEVRECSNIGIWIEKGTNCSVKAGCSESGVSVSGSGSYVNVSKNCDESPVDCNGVVNGTATLDNCDRCVGGTTGKTACASVGEAEQLACSYDGILESSNAGYKGTSYINVNNAIGTAIVFPIKVASAGNKTISFRYATTTDRQATVKVDGIALASALNFLATGAFTTYKTIDLTLNLSTGTHKLELVSTTADGLANIDQIGYVSQGLTTASCTDVITSITESNKSQSTEIYPNPSTSNFYIRLKVAADLEILNSEGRSIKVYQDVKEMEFGDDLQPGVYFAKVGYKAHKFIKH